MILPYNNINTIFLGPQLASQLWSKPMLRWYSRVLQLAKTDRPASSTALVYNARCLPTLSYIGQLADLPPFFETLERWALNKILHLPGNGFSRSTSLRLKEVGGPQFRAARATNMASQFRAANWTVEGWRENLFWMKEIASTSDLPFAAIVAGDVNPEFWDSPLHLLPPQRYFEF